MISRRSAIAALASSVLVSAKATAFAANSAIMTSSGASPSRPLALTEQLLYSTVRLHYTEGNVAHWGTGFLYAFFQSGQRFYPAIVTNRHVVAEMKTCSFSFASRNDDGSPNLLSHVDVTIPDFQNVWIPHPSADLVIIPIGQILNNLEGSSKRPYYVYTNQALIPTAAEFEDLTPVEQVLTVGFPGALWDTVHNLPIFHRGYTASAPYIDFDGRPEFLIDFSTWPGSSGSMVLLFNDQGWTSRNGGQTSWYIKDKADRDSLWRWYARRARQRRNSKWPHKPRVPRTDVSSDERRRLHPSDKNFGI